MCSMPAVLSGKYRFCRVLGRGQSSTVYLAVHKELKEYRVIKCMSRESAEYEQFLREAHMLRDLRHPGIPIIHDLAEDEKHCYLIEEYLSGNSLWNVVSTQGSLSKAIAIRYGIQICRLVQFLHSKTTPILFLDLHPKNLLLCDGLLKLVDFGQAVRADEAGKLTKRYGTAGFAAPEQYTTDDLDERTDLYAIGAVLYFMLTGHCPEPIPVYTGRFFDAATERILRGCLAPARDERIPNVAELEKELTKLTGMMDGGAEEQAVLSLTIAVAGARAGAGATHLAVGLTAHLSQRGISCIYEEMNSSGAIRQMADWLGLEAERDGCVRIKGVPFLPCYGPAVRLESPEACSVVIRDYGTDWPHIPLHQADAVFLVGGSRWWEQEAVYAACKVLTRHPGFALIYNHISGQKIILPSEAKKAQCFPMPFFPDPFANQSRIATFYQTVLKSSLGGRKELDYLCCEDSVCAGVKRLFRRRPKRSGS